MLDLEKAEELAWEAMEVVSTKNDPNSVINELYRLNLGTPISKCGAGGREMSMLDLEEAEELAWAGHGVLFVVQD